MVPVGFLPYYSGMSGLVSMWILLVCNLWMVYVSILLLIRMDAKSARRVMFSSYFYLMIVLLAIFANRI
jgi:heme o synthase